MEKETEELARKLYVLRADIECKVNLSNKLCPACGKEYHCGDMTGFRKYYRGSYKKLFGFAEFCPTCTDEIYTAIISKFKELQMNNKGTTKF